MLRKSNYPPTEGVLPLLTAQEPSVLLISMPWAGLTEPSLGLGILSAVLARAGIPCRVWHLNVYMLQFLRAVSYHSIANVYGLNDFLFSGILDQHISRRQERLLRQKVRELVASGGIDVRQHGGVNELLKKVVELRQVTIPNWLAKCASEVAGSPTTLVGFACMFDQTIASLALAKLIKDQAPDKLVALGGYAVRPPNANELLKSFPWIDAVCIGEGERTIEALAKASAGMLPLCESPNLLYRADDGTMHASPVVARTNMDDVPPPNFDNFYQDLAILDRNHKVRIHVTYLPFESSRGCWWGAKHHCVFCGIHDEDLVYRHKSPQNILSALKFLRERYRTRYFRFSDYILPHSFYQTLLPTLASANYKLSTELKANISPQQFALLAAAGMTEVQPGIESFSTPVLRKMDKGVTGIQNVHTLLLGKRFGVTVRYNLLYGFPDDAVEDYEMLAGIIPRLRHLDPPASRVPVQITRYAPLQTNPGRFGIGPSPHESSYDVIFSPNYLRTTEFNLDAYCYYFQRPFENAPRLKRLYRTLEAQVDTWIKAHRERTVELVCEYESDGLKITDTRGEQSRIIQLNFIGKQVYLACERPIKVSALARIANQYELEAVIALLDAEGLIYREQDQILALALPRFRSHRSIKQNLSAEVRYKPPIPGPSRLPLPLC